MLDVSTPEDIEAGFRVEDIYASNDDPLGREEGYVLQVAREGVAVHAYAFTDHAEGVLLEAPPEVALQVANIILGAPPKPAEGFAGAVATLYRSDDHPQMHEAGYTLQANYCRKGWGSFILSDRIANADVTLPAAIARDMAEAVIASRPFPPAALN